jgi:ABC-type methionine transport system ATPase subunit
MFQAAYPRHLTHAVIRTRIPARTGKPRHRHEIPDQSRHAHAGREIREPTLGAQQQPSDIAQALYIPPKIMLFDETTRNFLGQILSSQH